MKKILIFSLVFFIILFTLLVKNSTKKIDDEIFIVKENLRDLKVKLQDARLEFDYLSSAEKLLDYQNLYFENKLKSKNINEFKVIKTLNKELIIQDLTIVQNNEK